MPRSADYWIKEYSKRDALWIHDGNPKRPHALLTSGNHSNGFFNSRPVISDTHLLTEAAFCLLDHFYQQASGNVIINAVVGPQTGATKLAELICDLLVLGTRYDCVHVSPAKSEVDGKKVMVFSDTEEIAMRGRAAILCEDVLTTGGSVDLTAAAVEKAGGTVLPYVLVLVNRSGLTEVNGKKIVALIDRAMPIWEPHECPLCKQGSEALRPKDNWARLNADY